MNAFNKRNTNTHTLENSIEKFVEDLDKREYLNGKHSYELLYGIS